MKRIYLVKKLTFQHGYVLNPHTPYQAAFDDERNLWLIHMGQNAPYLPVLNKFIEKVVDMEPVLV
jgi:hypothetical protein